jgi:cupin fold WbuC family metalloprotein
MADDGEDFLNIIVTMLIDDKLLDGIRVLAKGSPRLRMNYDLRNSEADGSQRMLNALEMGTVIPIHRHHDTSETQILLRGVIDVLIYDDEGSEVKRIRLDHKKGAYGVQVGKNEWHSLEVIEPAVIFEAKDGWYNPNADKDFLKK